MLNYKPGPGASAKKAFGPIISIVGFIGKSILFLSLFFQTAAFAQHSFECTILDSESRRPVEGAIVKIEGTSSGAVSDSAGIARIPNLSSGIWKFNFSHIGYLDHSESFTLPLKPGTRVRIFLEPTESEEGPVYISATRSGRTINAIPTRVEVIAGEELGEKAVMNSTNIAMLLRESTGIFMQQTSVNSGNQSIRIQGLDGRYTQLLRDGSPIFGGFAGGLSIMQVPPLDLAQVEVIKGSASTLYGGGAIAGLVNLVTKTPTEDPELSLMVNQTSAGGTTLNGFYGQKYGKSGLTLYTSANRQQPYDPNEDGFSDIPRVRSISVNPSLFLYPDNKTRIRIGLNGTFEDRIGGDLEVIAGNLDSLHVFSEENLSRRVSSLIQLDRTFDQKGKLNIKNSITYFNRELRLPGYLFAGNQFSTFSEASWSFGNGINDWVFGLNVLTENFMESPESAVEARDYKQFTTGIFGQNTWELSPKLSLESGLRTDYSPDYGLFPLPRVSLMFKPHRNFSGRIGGGLGYKLPTLFTEEAEVLAFREIPGINPDIILPERSFGGNLDLNYHGVMGEHFSININQLVYFTWLRDALVLEENLVTGLPQYINASQGLSSMGLESNVKLGYRDFKLFLQYAFNDVRLRYLPGDPQKPYTPRHSAGAVLMYEKEGSWRIGYELYYTGTQMRPDNLNMTDDYFIMGVMALREFRRFSLFINFENFTDTRQSKFEDMVYPPLSDPSFPFVYAPTDGFVFNGGIILKLMGGDHHHGSK
jgi:iron complex outermembrane receptor protein